MVSEAILRPLETRLRGELLRRGDDGYEEARRLWNGMIDRKPALIVRCTSVADVIEAVSFARESGVTAPDQEGRSGDAGAILRRNPRQAEPAPAAAR